MSKTVRIYIVDVKGAKEDLRLRAWQTETLLRRVVELRKGQVLTIRVGEDTPKNIDALDEFTGW